MINIIKKSMIILIILIFSPTILGISSDNYTSNSYVISSGGKETESSNYKTTPIIGVISGKTNSSSYNTYLGFFYDSEESSQTPNFAPSITDIQNIQSQTIIEGSVNPVNFYVLASDTNGVDDLNDTTLEVYFERFGENTRSNQSCILVDDINSTTANYTCTIGIWYFDGAGEWNISANIKDLDNNLSQEYYETFLIGSTTSMNFTIQSLSFEGVTPSSVNKTADDNITLYNIGNDPLSVSINASDLSGQTNPLELIYASNFTIDDQWNGCAGDNLQNNTEITLTGVIVIKGNNTNGEGIKDLIICLKGLSQTLSSQIYATPESKPWIITVS